MPSLKSLTQGRGRPRGRVRPTTTTTTTTTTPAPIYEEEYNDYEQYEDYTYDDSEEDDGDDGWAKAREMLEEEVVTSLGTECFFYSTFLGACQIW